MKLSKITFSRLVVINTVNINIGVNLKTALPACKTSNWKECTHDVSLPPFTCKTGTLLFTK